jgi:hypothetical protein
MFSHVQEILDQINKLLTESKNIFGPTVSSVISKTRCFRQVVRQMLLLLRDDLLRAYESLADYGTNKEMYREIRCEISHKETRQLKQFLDVCIECLNTTKDSYDRLCNVTKKLCVEIDQAKKECVKLLEEKKMTYSRRGLGVGAAGLAVVGGAAALALSPIAAPALAVVALGAGGTSGFGFGINMYLNPNDKNIKIIEDAVTELKQLNSIINNIQLCANECALTIRATARELESKDAIGRSEVKPDPGGCLKTYNIPECFGLDHNQLKKLTEHETDLKVTLSDLEENMKYLFAGAKEARAQTETCIKNFPGA